MPHAPTISYSSIWRRRLRVGIWYSICKSIKVYSTDMDFEKQEHTAGLDLVEHSGGGDVSVKCLGRYDCRAIEGKNKLGERDCGGHKHKIIRKNVINLLIFVKVRSCWCSCSLIANSYCKDSRRSGSCQHSDRMNESPYFPGSSSHFCLCKWYFIAELQKQQLHLNCSINGAVARELVTRSRHLQAVWWLMMRLAVRVATLDQYICVYTGRREKHL